MTRARLTLAVGLLAVAACKRPEAPTHLERAKTALFERKPEVALSEYKQALDSLERDTSGPGQLYRARALRGAADTYYYELGDYKRAAEVYRELIQVSPEAPETLEGRINLANLLQHEFRDIRGAIAELTAALARNPPQSAELAYRVATLYFELQDYEQCQIEANTVARRYENSAQADDALYLRGQALAMMEGRRAEAQRVYNELLERFTDSELRPHALVELGRLKADQGESEKAIDLWIEALKTHPDPLAVQDSIARVRTRLRATTPETIGDAAKAFDWGIPGANPVERPMPKTSIEAVGGSKEEAEREARMKAEGASAPPRGNNPTPHGEGSL